MMHDWAEQEEKMRERFPRRNDSKRSGDNRNDRNHRDYSSSSWKRKPDELVATMDRPQHGKKSTTQEQIEKLLKKKCPWHPGAKHTAIDCWQLKKTFGASSTDKADKPKDDEADED